MITTSLENIKTSKVTLRGVDGRTITVALPEDATPQEYVAVQINSSGWITIMHGKETFIEDPALENGGYTVHKAVRRITVPAQIVAEIHEEFAD